MRKILILAASFLIMNSVTVFAQNKVIEHKVGKGDTVTSLAREYNVTASDIYRLNPESIIGLRLDDVIKIPVITKTNVVTKTKTPIQHIVEQGETIYSISRKYDVKPSEIEVINTDVLKDVLKPGVVLQIPSKSIKADSTNAVVKTITVPQIAINPVKNIYHTVAPKETKYGIAKQYELTIDELESLNPEIKGTDSIDVGVVLRLSADVPKYGSVSVPNILVDYTIQPQETLYSLSKKAGVTEDEFIKINPNLADGVFTGTIIKMPSSSISLNKPVFDLTKNLSKYNTKNLVLLLPFNTDKITANKNVTVEDQLKRDKFLNITLDFYAGALIAIDSAKNMGLPIKVQILDSKENKTSSDITSLYAKGSFTNADAIIGPFFQNHVEELAKKLDQKNTPVVSPLSTEKGKSIDNLYQSMPSSNAAKARLIDYLKIKNGNIIAIVDPKKVSARKYISEVLPTSKFAVIDERGIIDNKHLKQILDKNKTNYIVLETESLSLALNATKTLISNLSEFPIQLVTLDKNEILESEQVPLNDLLKLKLLYPSVTRDVTDVPISTFAKTFKKYNGVMPNKFAIRGFDVTFDTILRLFNQDGFTATVENIASEQIENKFNYINVDNAYYNNGIYLLYYDTDLTIKEAN